MCFGFGIAPNVTGYAQVRFSPSVMQLLLATRKTVFAISLLCVKGGSIFARKCRRDCCFPSRIMFGDFLLHSQSLSQLSLNPKNSPCSFSGTQC